MAQCTFHHSKMAGPKRLAPIMALPSMRLATIGVKCRPSGSPHFPISRLEYTQHIHNQCGTRGPISIRASVFYGFRRQPSPPNISAVCHISNRPLSIFELGKIPRVGKLDPVGELDNCHQTDHLSCCQHIDVRNNTPLYRFKDLLVRHDVCFCRP